MLINTTLREGARVVDEDTGTVNCKDGQIIAMSIMKTQLRDLLDFKTFYTNQNAVTTTCKWASIVYFLGPVMALL